MSVGTILAEQAIPFEEMFTEFSFYKLGCDNRSVESVHSVMLRGYNWARSFLMTVLKDGKRKIISTH